MPFANRVLLRPLPPRRRFVRHLLRNAALGAGLIAVSLGLGVAGYRWAAGLGWIDSLLNASMILTGMGPVDPMTTARAKLFASAYALFSGVVFLTAVAVVFAPALQRGLHRFHLDLREEDPGPPGG